MSGDGPKFESIAEDLLNAIRRGDYAPGDRLPGENELAKRHGVAVMTARRALGVLKRLGKAESHKGGGTYVLSFQQIRRRSPARVSREQWGTGKSIWNADESRALEVDRVTIRDEAAPQAISDVLQIAPGGTACVRSRRYLIDGRPVMLSDAYLPSALVRGTPITRADTGPGGTYARLADLGCAPVHFREEVRVDVPSTAEAEALAIPLERAVIRIVRTAFSEDGTAVEVNDMTLDSAVYLLEYQFDA